MVWWSSHGLPTKAVQFGLMSQVNIGFRGELEGEGKGLCDFNADCSDCRPCTQKRNNSLKPGQKIFLPDIVIQCQCQLYTGLCLFTIKWWGSLWNTFIE